MIVERLHCMSFNVRGFRNPEKQKQLISLAREKEIDIIFLQETNFRTPQDVAIFKETNGVEGFFSLTSNRSCGTGVIFVSNRYRKGAFCTYDSDGRITCVDTFLGGRKVRFINVYAPVTRSSTNEYFKNLWNYMPKKPPCVVVGDFNCVLDSNRDIRGPGQGKSHYHARELKKLLTYYNMSDAWLWLHSNTIEYTRSCGKTESRLDRAYMSPCLLTELEEIQTMSGPEGTKTFSDHKAVIFTLKGREGPTHTPRMWRMDASILHDQTACEDIKLKLKKSLDNNDTNENWDDLKEEWKKILMEAGKNMKRRNTKILNEILRRIRIIERGGEQTCCIQEYLECLRAKYKHHLREIRQNGKRHTESQQCDQMNLSQPVHELNKDTEGKRRIEAIRTDKGEITTNEESIKEVFLDHFQKVLQGINPIQDSNATRLFENLPQVQREDHDQLCAPATKEEVFQTIKKMTRETAPGPDGILTGFYLTFFDIIGQRLVKMINNFIIQKKKPPSFANGRIILLAKPNNDPLDVNGWRPVTLLNTDYKIAAKILTNRLNDVLPMIISELQAAAVPGRSIFASLTLTRDIFTYVKQKQIKGAFITIDQEKAYDKVNHHYIYETMKQFGFPQDFIDIIKLLYKDITSEIQINNTLTDCFSVTRGVRQGCSLSPGLFVLTLDPLLRRVDQEKRMRGFPLPGLGEIKISAFADDISLFIKDECSYQTFLQIFEEYAIISGARINQKKSKALRFGDFREESLGEVQFVQAAKVLGLWFQPGDISPKSWDEPLKKAAQVAENPRHQDLSLIEKAEVVKTKLCSPAFYVARIAKMPRLVANRLTTLIGSFLWGKKPAPVTKTVTRIPPSRGGLGIPNVSLTARTLAAKTVSSLIHENNFLGKPLLRYWISTLDRFVTTEIWKGPRAEIPLQFYKEAVNTKKAIEELCPETPLADIKTAEISATMALKELNMEDVPKSLPHKWKFWKHTQLPKEVKDFEWKRRWGVLPTKIRLARFGITPSEECPNCKQPESQRHAFKECPSAKVVWKIANTKFRTNLAKEEKKKSLFEKLLTIVIMYNLWKRRGLAEIKKKPQKAVYPVLKNTRIMMCKILNEELEKNGIDNFLKKWHTKFWIVKENTVEIPLIPY